MTQKQFDNIKLPALIKYEDELIIVTNKYNNHDVGWLMPPVNYSEIKDRKQIYHFSNVELIQENYDQQREQMNEIEEML